MHYITLLFKCNALHYTLLFTNFKQTKLVHIETFTRTYNKADIILYGKQLTLLIFNFMFHKAVSTKKCQYVQEFQCSFCRKNSRILNQDVKIIY